jgi:hypothetical protein
VAAKGANPQASTALSAKRSALPPLCLNTMCSLAVTDAVYKLAELSWCLQVHAILAHPARKLGRKLQALTQCNPWHLKALLPAERRM